MAAQLDTVGKWNPGVSYGPVLTQTEIFLLKVPLQINPILSGEDANFKMAFDLYNGLIGGNHPSTPNTNVEFSDKHQPATLPRVTQLIILNEITPWVTIIKSDRGVTMNDVVGTLIREYSENFITDQELATLPARLSQAVKNQAQRNQPQAGWGGYYPSPAPQRMQRKEWLREKWYVQSFDRDDAYAEARLGFKSGNVLVMRMMS